MGSGIYTGKRIKTKDGVLTQSALSFYMDEVYDLNDAVWAVSPTTQFLYFFKSLHNNNKGNDPFLDTTRQHWDFIYTDQIQVTNPYSLGMTIKSCSSISSPSWLKSDAIAKDGAIYVSMYNKLLDVNTTGTSGTITIGSTTYNTKEKDGFVVISATDWQTIYSNYGIVAQFGIDTTNQQFYLPYGDESKRVLVKRKKPTNDDQTWYNLYSDGWVEQGGILLNNYSNAKREQQLIIEMADTNYTILATSTYPTDGNPATYPSFIIQAEKTTNSFVSRQYSGAVDPFYWEAKGYTNVVEGLYNRYSDYYYVGETIQNQSLIDISKVLNKINNALYVVASDYISSVKYEVYSNGRCRQWGYQSYPSNENNTTITLQISYLNTDYNILLTYDGNNSIGSESEICVVQSAKQTKSFQARHGAAYSLGLYWQTEGQVDLSELTQV